MESRLEPIIGVEIINDIRVGHTFYEIEVLEKFISDQKPDTFIEIGVHEGGMSYMLIPKLPFVYYVGVELYCDLIRPVVKTLYDKSKNTFLFCMDCFSTQLYEYLASMDHKIIYCDGGAKAKEILHFKDTLHPGDIILCHDFYDGTRKVRGVPKENISIEVTASDVQIYENDTAFERLSEDIFGETRIIGWKKITNDLMDTTGS